MIIGDHPMGVGGSFIFDTVAEVDAFVARQTEGFWIAILDVSTNWFVDWRNPTELFPPDTPIVNVPRIETKQSWRLWKLRNPKET